MKAAFIEATGPAANIRIGSVDVPAVQPQQVLVRTGAVAVNPIDTYVRSGNVTLELPPRYIVGCDIAGTVAAVGADVTVFPLVNASGAVIRGCAVDRERLLNTRPSTNAGCTELPKAFAMKTPLPER